MATLNALILDEATGRITIPAGGTGSFTARLIAPDGVTLDTKTDVAVLGIGTADENGVFKAVHQQEYPLTYSGGMYVVDVVLDNQSTRKLLPGKYNWDLTIVTSPARDPVTGNVITDAATDNVYPVYASAGKLPEFRVKGAVPVV